AEPDTSIAPAPSQRKLDRSPSGVLRLQNTASAVPHARAPERPTARKTSGRSPARWTELLSRRPRKRARRLRAGWPGRYVQRDALAGLILGDRCALRAPQTPQSTPDIRFCELLDEQSEGMA